MSSPPTRARCAPGTSVRQLLDAVAPALVAEDTDTLIHIVRRRRTFDLGLLPLAHGEAAIDQLIGASAPREWHALGFVTGGTARSLGPDGGVEADTASRVRLAILADRSGAVASTVHLVGDGLDLAPVEAGDDEPPTGWVVDVCQRALGIPTVPAEQGVGAWLDVVWLDALLAAVSGAPARPWPWADLASLHPLQPNPVPTPRALAADTRCAVTETSWSRLRALVAAGDPGAPSPGAMTSDLAAWLDDGAFARYLIGGYPPAATLLGALAQLLPTGEVTAVREALVEPP